MMTHGNWVIEFFSFLIMFYSIFIISSYIILTVFSVYETTHYVRKNSFIKFNSILSSPLAPSVSLIAPAYNEEASIVENIKSILTIYYVNYQVIVVNDGSKDSTLQRAIDHYDLVKVPYAFEDKLDTKTVRGIYKSTIPEYKNLLVVDKENGGKSDALNVGLNVCRSELVACIDVDCILEEDSMLRMVKPFLERTDKTVIATGGVVRIANDCRVDSGRISNIRLPAKFLPRVQVMEYIRAFLLSRMAWSRLDGLLIISGAFGMFKTEVAINSGGYDHGTVGEDMEMVIRMRKYMQRRNEPYRVSYIPDPLCWTEAPEDINVLFKQRNRWTRGNFETLWKHKDIALNPRFGAMGVLAFPYWFVFEWLAPLVEFLGVTYFLILAVFNRINWFTFLLFLISLYGFSLCFSSFAIYFEEKTYHQYKSKRELFVLLMTAFFELFFFHPVVTFAAVVGNIDLIRGKKSWGTMERKGFATTEKVEATS